MDLNVLNLREPHTALSLYWTQNGLFLDICFFGLKYHILSPKNIKSENNLILGAFGVSDGTSIYIDLMR